MSEKNKRLKAKLQPAKMNETRLRYLNEVSPKEWSKAYDDFMKHQGEPYFEHEEETYTDNEFPEYRFKRLKCEICMYYKAPTTKPSFCVECLQNKFQHFKLSLDPKGDPTSNKS